MVNLLLRNRVLPVLAVLLILGIFSLSWKSDSAGVAQTLGPYLLSTATTTTWDDHHPTKHDAIPPIVHFVQLQPDETAELHFSFEAFLALYAAYRHVQPSRIYIHTDFSPEAIAAAIHHGSSWTRKVLTSFPDVVHVNHVTAPTHANGRPITLVEHRSDMVRLDQLARFGGIYLDWDVITLRPLAPLRHAGFRAVVGRQFDSFVNNGILLATPGSGVVDVMRQETPRVYDGGWITHSVALLTTVANALASVPAEVLIMDFKAFAPFEWSQASVDAELARHEGDAAAVAVGSPPAENVLLNDGRATVQQAWDSRRRGHKKDWEYDFSDAYFLHKFYNHVKDPKGFEGVSVPYILAHDSNYAVATWPIVMQGIQEGIIDPKDGSL